MRSFLPCLLAALLCHAGAVGAQEPAEGTASSPVSQAADARACLHGQDEAPEQRIRRLTAGEVAAVIEFVNRRAPALPATVWRLGPDGQTVGVVYLSVPLWWNQESAVVALMLRDFVGPVRDWGQRITWGAPEPFAGWRIEWAYQNDRYVFSLVDTLDPCEHRVRPGAPVLQPSPIQGYEL